MGISGAQSYGRRSVLRRILGLLGLDGLSAFSTPLRAADTTSPLIPIAWVEPLLLACEGGLSEFGDCLHWTKVPTMAGDRRALNGLLL